MKPPPLLLVLLLLLILNVGLIDASCSNIPNVKVYLNQEQIMADWQLDGSYITHEESNRCFLHCYVKKYNSNEQLIVIIPPNGKQVVMFTGLNCQDFGDSKNDVWNKRTYMFFREQLSIRKNLHVYLVFGIRPDRSNKWCRFDICIDCKTKSIIPSINYQLTRTLPNGPFFQWSQKGIPVSIKPQWGNILVENPADRDGAVEYISTGHPKFVLIYHRDVGAIIRTPMGQLIATIKSRDWPLDSFIQTFYVHTMKKGRLDFPEGLQVYRLNEEIEKGVTKWYEVEGSKGLMFYYFLAQGSPKICYWERINTEKPNTCPSLPHNAMHLSPIADIRKTSEAVRIYRSHEEPKLVLSCFKNREVNHYVEYFSEVTDSKGNHLVTITNIDCSTKDNVDHKVFVHSTYRNEDPAYFVVGTRWSVTDDWCTYNIYKNDLYTHTKWVYYDYNVNDELLTWEEGGALECLSLEKINIATVFTEPPREDLTSSHLWPADPISDSLVLHCYTSTTEGNTQPQYTNVIKTWKGEAIVSISGVDCLFKQAKDNMFYISKEKIGDNNYLLIGTKNSPEEKWCQYDVCVDCEKKEAKRNLQSFSLDYTHKWSEAGVKLGGESQSLLPDHNPKDIIKEYLSTSASKFVLECVKPKEEEIYKWVLRRSKGIQIATFTNDFECSEKNHLNLEFYIHSQSANGESNIYNHEDCSDSCDLHSDSNIETWFYYFVNREGLRFLKVKDKAEPNSREGIKRENIITKETVTSYWNGGNVRFTLTCYHSKNQAVITRDDEHILTIIDSDCNEERNVQNLYIHTTSGDEDISQVVLGSRKFRKWSYYNVFRNVENNNVWLHYDYQPNELAQRWYKQGTCSGVSSDSISLDEDDKDLDNKRFISRHMEVVSGGVDQQKELFYTYCYHIDSDGGDESHAMVIINVDGHHLVTIRDFDCSTFKLEENAYIFTMADSGDQNYLAFGTRTSTEDEWCQYEICLNCKPEQVRTNIYLGKREHVFWEKTDSNSCPAIKGENILTGDEQRNVDNDKSNTGDTPKPSPKQKFKQFYSKHLSNRKLSTSCFYSEGAEASSKLVINDAEGRNLASIQEFDCSAQSPIALEEKIYTFTLTYSGHKYLALGTRTSYEDKWCRYDICFDCETTTVRRNVHIGEEEEQLVRSEVPTDKPACEPINYSYVKLEDYKVIATYISEDEEDEDTLVLVCYENQNLEEGERIVAHLETLGGKPVASIKNLDCSSRDMLSTIHYMSTIITVEDNRYLTIERAGCRYEICISCSNKEIVVKAITGLGHTETLKWSMVGIDAKLSTPNNCEGFAVGSRNPVSRYAHTEHMGITIDCYSRGYSQYTEYCAVIKRHETHLVSFTPTDCNENNLIFQRNFYLYTKFMSEYNLIRLDQRKDLLESKIKKLLNPYYRYLFCTSDTTKHWIQVKNPDKSSIESVEKLEDETECLPKSKIKAEINLPWGQLK